MKIRLIPTDMEELPSNIPSGMLGFTKNDEGVFRLEVIYNG